ncbi:MAG: uroporphyrinogen decarboxylase [Elusimicrobia bacterium]|nr:uroporphyrinogen decarboxylase [Elusimicrobiota bacterium]
MNDRFLRACRKQPVDTVPVWIMRQAGRYLPEYMEVRRQHDFLTVCKTPELAAQVTLQPVDRLGVDAAILFSDILIPVEAMGVPLQFLEKKGPVLGQGVRDRSAVEALRVPDPVRSLGFVLDAIRVLRKRLADKVPLIGFSGLPFTLASYMVEGGKSKDFAALRSLMKDDRKAFASLMDKLTEATIAYLGAQISAGAQAVQIFDTWAGILEPAEYQARVFPYTCRVAEAVRGKGVPVIHFTESCAKLLPVLKDLPVDVLSIDWRVPLDQAAAAVGPKFVLQGNLAPEALFRPRAELEAAAGDILARGRKAGGHIFNLGHGILPKTDPEAAAALVAAVHRLGRK